MSEVTVKQLADDVRIPVDRLLTQLVEAGINKSNENDVISEEEKLELLSFLRKSHGKDSGGSGDSPKKITLKRRTVSELKQPGAAGGGRAPTRGAATRGAGKTVSVEVRRKRTYVKRDTLSEDQEVKAKEAEEAKKALAEQAEKQRAQEELEKARREAEEARKAQLDEDKRKKDEKETQRKEQLELEERSETERKKMEEQRKREQEEERKEREAAQREAAQVHQMPVVWHSLFAGILAHGRHKDAIFEFDGS